MASSQECGTAVNSPSRPSKLDAATEKGTLAGSSGYWRLFASRQEDDMNQEDDDEEEDDDDDDDTNEGRMRKRDRIKDWFSSSGDDSSSRSRVKAKFDNLLSGMPSLSDMLADRSDDDEDTSTGGVRRRNRKDPAWFEQEKKRIMDR